MENEVRGAQNVSPLPAGSLVLLGFPGSSADKESICNTGEPSSIPESGSSTGEGIGYPHQYSWASLVAQLVKNLPEMWETWVGKILWRWERLPTPIFWPGELHGLYSPWGLKELDTTERLSLTSLRDKGVVTLSLSKGR